MITLAYINFWEDVNNDDYFTIFIEKNIGKVRLVNYNENPDILISSVNGDIYKIKNINAKCKVFFYGENLHNYPPYNNDALLYDTFDLIVGFKETVELPLISLVTDVPPPPEKLTAPVQLMDVFAPPAFTAPITPGPPGGVIS